jgi:phage terminase small subunit
MSLNIRQQKFVDHLGKGMSATDAAIAAGYSQNRRIACVTASRLLRQSTIAQLLAAGAEKAGITVDEIIAQHAAIARSTPDSKTLTFADKRGSLDSLARIKGMMQQESQFQQNVFNIAIVIEGGNQE